jgi:hypothetical protein
VRYGCAIAGFLIVTGIAVPRPAAAQGVNFAAGYSFLRDNDIDQNLPGGIFASLGVGANRWLDIVGEIASNRKKLSDIGDDITLNVDFYGGGVRFVGHSGAAHPYGQILVGAARGKISAAGESEAESNFAWQPGAGVDVYFSRSVGMRFGVNGRFIEADEVTSKEVQVIVGFVFGGRR